MILVWIDTPVKWSSHVVMKRVAGEAGAIDDTYPCDPEALDHGVLAVAYGVQDDTKYWVIKNSWGDAWGEDGYYRIERGTDHCGVANMVQHTVYKEN